MKMISQQITAFHIKGKTLNVLENLLHLGQGKESVVRHGNKVGSIRANIDKLDIIAVKTFPL